MPNRVPEAPRIVKDRVPEAPRIVKECDTFPYFGPVRIDGRTSDDFAASLREANPHQNTQGTGEGVDVNYEPGTVTIPVPTIETWEERMKRWESDGRDRFPRH